MLAIAVATLSGSLVLCFYGAGFVDRTSGHAGEAKSLPHTVVTSLGVHNCLKCLCKLYPFLETSYLNSVQACRHTCSHIPCAYFGNFKEFQELQQFKKKNLLVYKGLSPLRCMPLHGLIFFIYFFTFLLSVGSIAILLALGQERCCVTACPSPLLSINKICSMLWMDSQNTKTSVIRQEEKRGWAEWQYSTRLWSFCIRDRKVHCWSTISMQIAVLRGLSKNEIVNKRNKSMIWHTLFWVYPLISQQFFKICSNSWSFILNTNRHRGEDLKRNSLKKAAN